MALAAGCGGINYPDPPANLCADGWRTPSAAIAGLTVSVFLIAAALGGSFYGQSTRHSDVAVASLVKAEDSLSDEAQEAALEAQEDRIDNRVQKRVRKLKRNAARRLRVQTERAYEDGQSAGYDSGYSSGNTAGYSVGNEAGVEEGIEEGIEQGSDELVCSDDLDVPLPPCNFDY